MAKDYEDNNIEESNTGTVDWSIYLQQGVIIDLQIKRYRGTTTIGFPELGINPDSSTEFSNFLTNYLKPGQKRLIPPEIESSLKSIETQARNNLKECSYDCSAFDSTGKFVPASAYQAFKEQNKEFEKRFWAIRDEFANSYDDIIERVRKDYELLAVNLYKQSHPDAKRIPTKFVKEFVDSIVQQIPPREEIIATFEYNTYLRRIPPYLLNVIKKKNKIDEKTMKIAATIPPQPKEKNKKQKENTTTSEMPVSDSSVLEETTYAKFSDDPALDKEIENDLMQSMEIQSDAVFNGFIHEIRTKIRNTAIEGANQIISSIDKNGGKLVGRASIKAHNLVDELNRMDYGDAELKQVIDSLSDALQEEEGQKRDVSKIKEAAISMRDWASQSLKEINKQYAPIKKNSPAVQTPSIDSQKGGDKEKRQTKSRSKKKSTIQIAVPKKSGGRRSPKTL